MECVERGELDRVMVFMPPRHGKSLLISQRMPAWYLSRNPTREVIHSSYGGELVTGFGRRLRNLMDNQVHASVFPEIRLAADSKAANLWHTEQDGVYCASGVGGPITGRGMHLGLVDDPVKSREEADSERMRDRVWDWYQNDFYTRLMPGGAIVLVMTRWHEDDLAGRLLLEAQSGGDRWHVLHHPAISDEGEALWPERYPIEVLHRIQRNIGPRAWEALYQGNPAPEEGAYFMADWFVRGPVPPVEEMKIYGASDYAVTEDDGDYTVHLVVGIDNIDRMWVLDLWRKQTTSDKWVSSLIDLMNRWKPIRWAEEGGQIEKGVGPFLAKEQLRRKAWCHRVQFVSAKNKSIRAQGRYRPGCR